MPTPARLTALSSTVLTSLAEPQIKGCLDYFDPDAVVLTETDAIDVHWAMEAGPLSDFEVLTTNPPPYLARQDGPTVYSAGDVDIVVPASLGELSHIDRLEDTEQIDPTTETYVISDYLEVEIQPTTLSASLDGLDAYRDALPDLIGSYTHVTLTAGPGYRRQWDELRVVGGGSETGDRAIPTLGFHPDGTVAVESIKETQLGLRAVDQVGPKTAKRLRENGVTTRDGLVEMDITDLTQLQGVTRSTAETILDAAKAITTGDVVVQDHDGFPNQHLDPVFIDIETDGLTPTAVWLVGVLDDDRYIPFVQRDPDAEGEAVESFMNWYTANAAHRPLVAYHGNGFDFEVLAEHIAQHCPQYLDDWTESYRFDPLDWARQGHAILPGQTNKLADVAEALGWPSDTTGLTGGAVAHKYRRWCRERTPETELDWQRHNDYCEDDVRALAHVYDALASAEPGECTSTSETGTQGKLTDF